MASQAYTPVESIRHAMTSYYGLLHMYSYSYGFTIGYTFSSLPQVYIMTVTIATGNAHVVSISPGAGERASILSSFPYRIL